MPFTMHCDKFFVGKIRYKSKQPRLIAVSIRMERFNFHVDFSLSEKIRQHLRKYCCDQLGIRLQCPH